MLRPPLFTRLVYLVANPITEQSCNLLTSTVNFSKKRTKKPYDNQARKHLQTIIITRLLYALHQSATIFIRCLARVCLYVYYHIPPKKSSILHKCLYIILSILYTSDNVSFVLTNGFGVKMRCFFYTHRLYYQICHRTLIFNFAAKLPKIFAP